MEEMREFRCMRCGHEFRAAHRKDGALVERTCPQCRSNSIRLKKEAPPAGAGKGS